MINENLFNSVSCNIIIISDVFIYIVLDFIFFRNLYFITTLFDSFSYVFLKYLSCFSINFYNKSFVSNIETVEKSDGSETSIRVIVLTKSKSLIKR